MGRLSREELEEMAQDGAKVVVRPPPPNPLVVEQKRLADEQAAANEINRQQLDLSARIAEELARMNLKVPSQIRAKVTRRDEDGRIDTVDIQVVK